MIKNIVFDMGKVLLDFDPVGVCRHYTDSEEDIKKIGDALFFSEEWSKLDEGVITEEEAMVIVQGRLSEPRLKELAALSLAHWHEYNLRPKEGMEELVREIKENGFSIYLCSNASHRLRVFEHMIPGISYFDGVLVSAEEKLLKPDVRIYERLFEKFSLDPAQSYFIDDLPDNIEGAKKAGMAGYCFADGDVELLRRNLIKLGVLA